MQPRRQAMLFGGPGHFDELARSQQGRAVSRSPGGDPMKMLQRLSQWVDLDSMVRVRREQLTFLGTRGALYSEVSC